MRPYHSEISLRVRVGANACVTREDGAVNRRVFRQVTLSTCTKASPPSLSDSLSFFRAVAQRDSLYVCLPLFILIYSTLTRLNALRRVRAPRAVSRCPRERIVTYVSGTSPEEGPFSLLFSARWPFLSVIIDG